MQITKQFLAEVKDHSGQMVHPLRYHRQRHFPAKRFPDGVPLSVFWLSYEARADYYSWSLIWLALTLLPRPDRIALALRFAGQAMRYAGSEKFGDKLTAANLEAAMRWASSQNTRLAGEAYHAVYEASMVANYQLSPPSYEVHTAMESSRQALGACMNSLVPSDDPMVAVAASSMCKGEQVRWAREALVSAGIWSSGDDNE